MSTKAPRSTALKRLVDSSRNMLARLSTAVMVTAAALPIMPWWRPTLWLVGVVALLIAEGMLVPSARSDPGRDETDRYVNRLRVTTTISGLNYSIMLGLFWFTGDLAGQMFAATLSLVVAFYLMLLYFRRPKILPWALAPVLTTFLLGASALAWGYIAQGSPWVTLTVVMTVAIALISLANGRVNMTLAWNALRTARSRALQRGVEAEAASSAKSAFLATMSHEIRTPLNGVLGMAQAMNVDDLSPVQRERLAVIRQSGEALLVILNDVLDLSKIEAGKLDLEHIAFDLGEVVATCHQVFVGAAEAKGLTLSIHVAADADGVYLGDPTRIRQILSNLLSNAMKFTAKGGISIDVDRQGADGAVRIAIGDTGEGIAPEQLAKLFERFVQADASTTRRHGGTGLGLAICLELAELMGGRMEVASLAAQGSTFTLVLPLERIGDAEAISATPEAILPPEAVGLRVLVVEDNPMNQMVLKTLLEQIGVAPAVAGNGREAVEAWRRGDWDVILMDVQMPVMDGPSAARAIRAEETAARRPRTPIIALTANAMEHQVAEYRAAGMDGHVSKPIDVARLYEALSQVITDQPIAPPTALSA